MSVCHMGLADFGEGVAKTFPLSVSMQSFVFGTRCVKSHRPGMAYIRVIVPAAWRKGINPAYS